jgi:lysophospholipase L1-like esterase
MVLGLGDSALTGQGCSCPDLLVDYAELAGARIGKDIQARNEAEAGSTSKDLVDGLGGRHIRSEIDAADVVVLFTGANDFVDAFYEVAGGGAPKKHYGPVADKLRKNVETTVARVRRRNAHARIVVCGYWNDFKAGSVARHEYSNAQRKAADKATDYTNRALHSAADRAGAHYVSTRELFRDEDITPYLASDGDHLSAAGHRRIARALVDLLHPDHSAQRSAAPTAPAPAQNSAPAQNAHPAPVSPLPPVPLRPTIPPRI